MESPGILPASSHHSQRSAHPLVVALNIAIGLALVAMLAYWGGAVRTGPLFVLGIAVLTTLLASAGYAAWWLFLSPLPSAAPRQAHSSAALRQSIALLAVGAGMLQLVGAFWDEIWHRVYGAGAAIDDFLWPPHLMIYGSMAIMSAFALGALVLVARGSGGLRERVRAEPLIGWLSLAAAYLALSGPSDLIWHQIYGRDISAWSLPHLLLSGGSWLVMLLSVALLQSSTPRPHWRGLSGLQVLDMLAILLIAIGTMFITVILVSEWEGIAALGGPDFNGNARTAFWQRPEWLYPVILSTLGILTSAVAIHTLRRAGAATLVMLAILALRLALFTSFGLWDDAYGMSFTTQLLMLPPALALDAWYALSLRRARTPLAASLLAALAFFAVALPALPLLQIYPRVTTATVPPMLLGGLLLAPWAGWVGARVGDWLAGLGRDAREPIPLRGRPVWATLAFLAALGLGALAFVATAAPPA